MIYALAVGVYLVGAYAAAFVSGYFDYEPVGAASVFWPVYVLAWLLIAALMPFVWFALWAYQFGQWLRGEARR